jgi:hypothetical protein
MIKNLFLAVAITAAAIGGAGHLSGANTAKTGDQSGDVLLETNFNGMKLGGDAIADRGGVALDTDQTPWDTSQGVLNLPNNPVYKECKWHTLGVNLFGTGTPQANGAAGAVSEEYKALRGLKGDWTGSYVFEQPGYVAFGHSGRDGYLVTPALKGINKSADIKVSFKVARRKGTNADTQVTVSVIGKGSIKVDGQQKSSSRAKGGIDLPVETSGEWILKEVVITGAAPNTKIKFENTIREKGSRNFSLDDLVISIL